MRIESIKARLRRHDRQRMRYGYSDETAPQIWERDLHALLKVAESAEARMEMWTAETYADLRAALTALREAQS